MNRLMKILGFAMLIIGILITLDQFNIYNVDIGIDKFILGSIIIISVQVLNIILSKIHNGIINPISIIMLLVITIPVILYFFYDFGLKEHIKTFIGIMMIFESIYMLH